MESERNRPAEYQDESTELVLTPEVLAVLQQFQQAVETGMAPEVLADQVFQAVKNDQFYILTHPKYIPMVKARMEAIVQINNPKPLTELNTLIQD